MCSLLSGTPKALTPLTWLPVAHRPMLLPSPPLPASPGISMGYFCMAPDGPHGAFGNSYPSGHMGPEAGLLREQVHFLTRKPSLLQERAQPGCVRALPSFQSGLELGAGGRPLGGPPAPSWALLDPESSPAAPASTRRTWQCPCPAANAAYAT